MNYTYDDEYKMFERDPVLRQIKERIESRSSGKRKFEGYLNTRVELKNHEAKLMKMDSNDPSYAVAKQEYERRRQLYLDAEKELEGPMNTLEKVENAKSIVTGDPWEKALDIFERFFSNKKEDAPLEKGAEKPSLWNVFWK